MLDSPLFYALQVSHSTIPQYVRLYILSRNLSDQTKSREVFEGRKACLNLRIIADVRSFVSY